MKNLKRGSNVTIHVIVWAMIYIFPMLVTYISLGSFLPMQAYIRYVVIVSELVAVFYMNYVFLVDRYLFKAKPGKYTMFNLMAFLLLSVLVHGVNVYIATPPDVPFNVQTVLDSAPVKIGLAITLLSLLVIVTLLAISFKATGRVHVEEEKRQRLEKEKTEAELKNLKDKLNPHFLFNALNNIYALTAFDQQKAQAAIDSLSNLLRYVLYENDSAMVSLEGELEFTLSYIDLMALRLDPAMSALKINTEDIPAGNWTVASLLFVTLIENAFKHGVSSRDKSSIEISIRFYDGMVECYVANNLFSKASSDKSGSGIGLENLRQRLEILYEDEYVYDVNTVGNMYSVRLIVPLRQAAPGLETYGQKHKVQ